MQAQLSLITWALLVYTATVSSAAAEPPPATAGSTWDRQGAKALDIDMTDLPSQIPAPAPGDTSWPYYNARLDGVRYSDLQSINENNAGNLEEACRVHLSGPGPLSSGILLVNGVLYVTAARATVAVQPATCDVIWKALYLPDEREIYNANRGVGYLDGKLFRGTGDGRLVAYDANSGRELWRTKFGDPANGEYLDAAPLAWKGMVFIGVAPSDLGIAGRMKAFDANDGHEIWNFNTVAQSGEYGNDTWPADTWKTGGGGTWSTYSLDATTGELFVPVDNPAPAFDANVRHGDNLFTDSVLVLDAQSGRRRWHYQVLKNDNHDYGLSSAPVLFNLDHREMVAQASKDGNVYLIDRAKRALIWKAPVTTLLNDRADATPAGVKICPGAKGGVEYNSPAYDPKLNLLIVGSVDWCYRLFAEPYARHVPGAPYTGGRMDRADDTGTGWITALDARTGKVRWRYHTPAPVVAALTPTAGGITLAGDLSGKLYIFRTADGNLLHTIDTGGAMAGGLITYQIQNHQYIAVESGNISRSSWSGAAGTPTLIVYRLPEIGSTTDLHQLTPNPANGERVFASACASCHGSTAEGQTGPRLQGIGSRFTLPQTIDLVAHPLLPMPTLYPNSISGQDVVDVAAYVHSLPAQ
jgi:PQQ-dependent dehydrogenase (methanol/ethanol family)